MSARFLAWCWRIEDAIREAMYKDFGSHSNATTDLAEVLGVAERAAYVISQIEKWTAVDSGDVDSQMYGQTRPKYGTSQKVSLGTLSVSPFFYKLPILHIILHITASTQLLLSF